MRELTIGQPVEKLTFSGLVYGPGLSLLYSYQAWPLSTSHSDHPLKLFEKASQRLDAALRLTAIPEPDGNSDKPYTFIRFRGIDLFGVDGKGRSHFGDLPSCRLTHQQLVPRQRVDRMRKPVPCEALGKRISHDAVASDDNGAYTVWSSWPGYDHWAILTDEAWHGPLHCILHSYSWRDKHLVAWEVLVEIDNIAVLSIGNDHGTVVPAITVKYCQLVCRLLGGKKFEKSSTETTAAGD